MNIVILDDYQDAVRKLACSQLLEPYSAKVYTNTVCDLKTPKFWCSSENEPTSIAH